MESVAQTRILVIDEDASMVDMLRQILSPSVYQVFEAKSAQEGITSAQLNRPDVIVLDLLTRDMESWEICRQIRAFSQVPILIISPVSKPAIVTQALDAGADDFLLKPVPSSVMIANLNKLARRSQAERRTSTQPLIPRNNSFDTPSIFPHPGK